MLGAGHRLTDPDSFRAASRRGRRAGSRILVTHLLPATGQQVVGDPGAPDARVGFVVSKAVGTAVVRNRVKRRLRHAMRDRVVDLPAGSVLVVRAQPRAAAASYPELTGDLDRLLRRVTDAGEEDR